MMQLLSIALALLANLSTAEASNDADAALLRLRRGDGDGVTADLVEAVAVATDDIDVVDASRQDFIENQADADKRDIAVPKFLRGMQQHNGLKTFPCMTVSHVECHGMDGEQLQEKCDNSLGSGWKPVHCNETSFTLYCCGI
eukprot:scaffold2378_cov152-Skeletonema_menzelii.AAC.13